MCNRKLRAFVILLTISVFASAMTSNALGANTPKANAQGALSARVIRQVRHELVTLPYYGVFDWLQFEVRPDNTVVLRGEVVKPTTKSDAEARVKDVDGVSNVVNNIEVLPLSPQDDRLRRALYRKLYGHDSPLFRYGTQSVPSIRIGIGFAIPSNMARTVTDTLVKTGKVRRGQLGIAVVKLNSQPAKGLGITESKGVGVAQVQPGSAADQAGLRKGDVITAL